MSNSDLIKFLCGMVALFGGAFALGVWNTKSLQRQCEEYGKDAGVQVKYAPSGCYVRHGDIWLPRDWQEGNGPIIGH